jgi:hypothetical protein
MLVYVARQPFTAIAAHHLIRLLMSTFCRRALPTLGPPTAGTARLCCSSCRTLAASEVGAWHVKFWHTKAAGLQGPPTTRRFPYRSPLMLGSYLICTLRFRTTSWQLGACNAWAGCCQHDYKAHMPSACINHLHCTPVFQLLSGALDH